MTWGLSKRFFRAATASGYASATASIPSIASMAFLMLSDFSNYCIRNWSSSFFELWIVASNCCQYDFHFVGSPSNVGMLSEGSFSVFGSFSSEGVLNLCSTLFITSRC